MQQVNLFPEEFAPQTVKLNFRTVVFAGLAALVIVSMIGMLLYQRVTDARNTTRDIYTRGEQIMTSISHMQGDRKAQLDATQRKESLKTTLEYQRQLLVDLKARAMQEQQGFSNIFHALAQVQPRQVWLTRITISGGKISLNGETSNAKALPDWLMEIHNTTPLKKHRFNHLIMMPIEQKVGLLSFQLSEVADEPK